MKDVLRIIADNKVGYKFQCDDRRKSQEHLKDHVNTDDYFLLTEVDKLNEVLTLCNDNHLNYNLILEEWSEEDQEITNEIYIISNNHKNN
tara:strand:+ start:437 stop:706 length:270 start_codon:yes stop_codon:yes gene_type:complete